jgi:hypothetical protein
MISALVVVEGLLFGVLDVFIRNPEFKRFFDVQYFHRDVTSDIPGNPHVFGNMLISLYNTLPEPSNFNMVWTNIHYREPIIIRGRIPTARINSLTCYSRPGGANYPCSVDLASVIDKNGRFEVFVARHGDESVPCPKGMHKLSSADWERGFICMRNYEVPPGTVYETPEIVRAVDDKIIRRTKVLISGPANLQSVFERRQRVLLFSRIILYLVIKVINDLFLGRIFISSSINSLWSSLLVVGIALVVSKVLTKQLFKAGKKRLHKQTAFCTEKNKFYLPDEDQAANGSQPCTLHKYWVMQYDIPKGSTLSLTGIINPADQKYWSFVLYDENGVSMPQYAHDVSVRKGPVVETSTDDIRNDAGAYSFDVRIINEAPTPRPHKDPLSEPWITKVFLGKGHSRGYVMFRRVHPAVLNDASGNEAIISRALRIPVARLIGSSADNHKSKIL